MRRRRRKGSVMAPLALSAVLVGCIGGMGYAAYQQFGKVVPDRYGCYTEAPQTHTAVLIDASPPRFNKEQTRSLRRYFAELYDSLGFNERLSVYTTEGDQIASVLSPRFHVCGGAKTAAELTAIGADTGTAGYREKQRARLYEKRFLPELEMVLTANPTKERLLVKESPLLEMVADLSRSSVVKPGSRIVLVSDLLQSSDSAHFCWTKGEMPPFYLFQQRRLYQQRLKPESLEGVAIEVLLLQRPDLGPYCRDEEELKTFWLDYFRANGVTSPRLIRLRHGAGG